jgi:hypothetical protein
LAFAEKRWISLDSRFHRRNAGTVRSETAVHHKSDSGNSPRKTSQNKINGRLIAEIKRPEPGHLGSSFESIRSGEIVPIFQRWFTIEWELEFDAFLRFAVPPGTRAALFEILMLLDHLCIEEKIVRPTGGQYLMRPKSVSDVPAKSATTDSPPDSSA